jgi:polar amino acid transport system substrate-binding protein
MNKIYMFFIFALFLATSALLLLFQHDTINASNSTNQLKIGMDLTHPPFEMQTPTGQPVGASVAIANSLGKYLETDIEIINTPYENLIPSLEAGKIDMILSSFSITHESLSHAIFSDSYTAGELSLLAYKDSAVQSPENLNSPEVIIAVKADTYAICWATTNAPKAQLKILDSESAAAKAVAQGNADVFIYETTPILSYQDHYSETTRVIPYELPNTSGWRIAVKKDNTLLLQSVNSFIESAKTDGTFDQIRETYLKEQVETFKKHHLKFFF